MLKARIQGGKAAFLPTLPGRSNWPSGFQGTISALSASSSFILQSSIPEDRDGKEEPISIK
jgi:hypothetical protein